MVLRHEEDAYSTGDTYEKSNTFIYWIKFGG